MFLHQSRRNFWTHVKPVSFICHILVCVGGVLCQNPIEVDAILPKVLGFSVNVNANSHNLT